mgnify:CR=1 FL=1
MYALWNSAECGRETHLADYFGLQSVIAFDGLQYGVGDSKVLEQKVKGLSLNRHNRCLANTLGNFISFIMHS